MLGQVKPAAGDLKVEGRERKWHMHEKNSQLSGNQSERLIPTQVWLRPKQGASSCSRASSCQVVQKRQAPVQVMLHVYDIGTGGGGRAINQLLRPLGTGIFHCGVEVYGQEWSYSDTTTGDGDGVFCSKPRMCNGHSYSESVSMGRTTTPESEVLQLVGMLKKDWRVSAYDLLAHNCCHFSNEFCQRLGVGSIPAWVVNLAGAGACVAAAGDTTCCRTVASQVVASTPCCMDEYGISGVTASGEVLPISIEVIDSKRSSREPLVRTSDGRTTT